MVWQFADSQACRQKLALVKVYPKCYQELRDEVCPPYVGLLRNGTRNKREEKIVNRKTAINLAFFAKCNSYNMS